MAKIRKIYDQTIKPDGSKTTIYPITSTRAVFAPDGTRLDKVLANLHVDLPYIALDSTSDLPPKENHNGYLIGENLYVWVGAGGDTLDGKYQNCGPFKGPRGTVLQPDNEDIRGTEANTLQFADRNNLEGEGMGYKILRKNKTFAEQLTQTDTIYEIRYDFDLGGASVTIPENCVLKFEGGKLSNGTIVGYRTMLEGNTIGIFASTIDFAGTWNVPRVGTEMFITADGDTINKLIALCDDDAFNEIDIAAGEYLVTPIYNASVPFFTHCVKITKSNIKINLRGDIVIKPNAYQNYSIVQLLNANNVRIEGNGRIIGDKDTHDYSQSGTHEWGFGVQIYGCNNINIDGVSISECTGDGIYVSTSENITINGVEIYNCRRQGISITDSVKNIEVTQFEIHHIDGTSPSAGIDVEPNTTASENIYIHDGHIHDCKIGFESFIAESSIAQASKHITIDSVIFADNSNYSIFINNNYNCITISQCNIVGASSRFVHCKVALRDCTINSTGNGIEGTYLSEIGIYNSIITATPINTAVINSHLAVYNSTLPIYQNAAGDTYNVYNNCNLTIDSGTWQWIRQSKLYNCTLNYKTTTAFQLIDSEVINCTFDYSQKADTAFSTYFIISGKVFINGLQIVSTKAVNASNAINVSNDVSGSILRNIFFSDNTTYTYFSSGLAPLQNVVVKNDTALQYKHNGTLPNDMRYIGAVSLKDNMKPLWWNGVAWRDALGHKDLPSKGTTADRPTAENAEVGFTYFDTTLGKMIVSNGSAWVNMDGSALS